MKKRNILYHSVGLFALPVLIICVLTAISAFATRNYEYLPQELDFLSTLFFYAAAYLLDIVIFYCVGAFCYSACDKKAGYAAVCAVIALFHAGLLPMLMFFVRSIFLADITSSVIMEQYWTDDVYTSMANFVRTSAAVLIGFIVALIAFLRNKENGFKKPYIAPNNSTTGAILAISAVYLLYTTLNFTFSGDYDFISLIMQIAFGAAGYFVMTLGAYMQKKNFEYENV